MFAPCRSGLFTVHIPENWATTECEFVLDDANSLQGQDFVPSLEPVLPI
jgi:hypothetical protein